MLNAYLTADIFIHLRHYNILIFKPMFVCSWQGLTFMMNIPNIFSKFFNFKVIFQIRTWIPGFQQAKFLLEYLLNAWDIITWMGKKITSESILKALLFLNIL